MVSTVTIHIPSSPEVFRTSRKLVSAAAVSAGASETDARDLEVAVGEALTNAYEHAYGQNPQGSIDIDLTLDGDVSLTGASLAVAVRDAGKRMRNRFTVPRHLPAAGDGGRGLYLIGKLVDEVDIIHPMRRGGGTTVRMIKRFHRRTADGGGR